MIRAKRPDRNHSSGPTVLSATILQDSRNCAVCAHEVVSPADTLVTGNRITGRRMNRPTQGIDPTSQRLQGEPYPGTVMCVTVRVSLALHIHTKPAPFRCYTERGKCLSSGLCGLTSTPT